MAAHRLVEKAFWHSLHKQRRAEEFVQDSRDRKRSHSRVSYEGMDVDHPYNCRSQKAQNTRIHQEERLPESYGKGYSHPYPKFAALG
jgi:hypothetical protein